MMRNKNLYFWGVVLLAGIGLLVYGFLARPRVVVPSPTPTPTPVPSISSPLPTSSGFVGPTGLKSPASCTIAGEITYLEKGIYASTEDAKITWKNQDSSGRLIKWRSEPKDQLVIGPNLFANLNIPSGSWGITVGLPEKPTAKEYTLLASITYGQLINGNVEVKETACAGTVKVKLNF